jgi:Domain of unknown function (DUF6504)
MAHRYAEPIGVTLVRARPAAFTWRGRRYTVTVIGTWHLMARWWQPSDASDRTYYRLQTPDFQVFEIYHDAIPDTWILDVCHD